MKVHIDRFIYLISFLKKYAHVSKSGYSSKDNPTFSQDKYERYDIKREKNPKTKKGSQSRQVKIKIEKTIK